MKTKIISAFPGTGKSHIYKNQESYNLTCLDSDSSKFDKNNFPQNYIEHIKNNIGKVDIIFVSSHKEVREALKKENIEYFVIFPNIKLCSEYCQRYINRGSSGAFIKLIVENWNDWIEDCMKENNYLQLNLNEYISDVLEKINKL